MAVLTISTGELSYVNAGHNPLLKRKNGQYEWLKSRPGFVLAGMEGVRYKEGSITLEDSDRLFLYTDGVTEATDLNKELFGEERLQNALNEKGDAPIRDVLLHVREQIDVFLWEKRNSLTILRCWHRVYAYERKDHQWLSDISGPEDQLRRYRIRDGAAGLLCPDNIRFQLRLRRRRSSSTSKYAYQPGREGEAVVRRSGGKPLEPDHPVHGRRKALNPLKKRTRTLRFPQRSEKSGLGILMVKKSMDAVNYEQGRQNILTIKKTSEYTVAPVRCRMKKVGNAASHSDLLAEATKAVN